MERLYDVAVCLISLIDVMFFCGTHKGMRNHQLEHPFVMVQKKPALICLCYHLVLGLEANL